MKHKILILALILMCERAAYATTRTATDCSAGAFQTQINASTDGDIVQGPASPSPATWSQTVTVTVGIKLDGRGCNITFTRNSGQLSITADNVASVSVTGFTMNNGFVNGSFPITINLQSSPTGPYNQTPRFYNNTLIDNNGAGQSICFMGVNGYGPVLIDHNSFTTAHGGDEMMHFLANGPSDGSGWTDAVTPGGPNMIFVEYNKFATTSSVTASAWEGYYGVRVVGRNSTFSGAQSEFHGGGGIGTRWWEIYNNAFSTGTGGAGYAMCFRAGSGIVTGNTGGGNVSMLQENGTYPANYQIGRGQNENLTPAYEWSDDGSSLVLNGIGCASPSDTLVQLNRDVYQASTGLLSARPSCSTSFQGYFATDTNTLYKCTSPNWAAYWTPFTNPHPLDNCGTTVGPTGCAAGPPIAATPTFNPVAGSYLNSVNVTITSATTGATIIYTTDGTTPSTQANNCTPVNGLSGANSVIVAVTTSKTLEAIACLIGDTNSGVGTAAYTIGALAAPTFNPAAGNYATAQTVAINSSSGQGVICYRIDGTPPAEGASPGTCAAGSTQLTNGGTISVAVSETVQALATAAGFTHSSVASAVYQIGVIVHVNSAAAITTSASPSWTFSYTAAGTGNAVLISSICHASSGTPTTATLTAPGWTINQVVTITGTGAGSVAATFGSIAPNTSAATFTVTFSGGGITNCSIFSDYLVDEFAGNSTVGGATTFNATGTSGGSTGCNTTAANVTPPQNNQAVWFTCFDGTAAATSPWITGANSGGGDVTGYQIFSGGAGVARTPAFTSTSGNYIVEGVAISTGGGVTPPTPPVILVAPVFTPIPGGYASTSSTNQSSGLPSFPWATTGSVPTVTIMDNEPNATLCVTTSTTGTPPADPTTPTTPNGNCLTGTQFNAGAYPTVASGFSQYAVPQSSIAAVTVTQNTIIKALATKTGFANSPVVPGTYVIDDACIQPSITNSNGTPALTPYLETAGSASWASGITTVTLNYATNIAVGENFTVTGATPAAFNGNFTISAVGGNQISYAQASNPGALTTGGYFYGLSGLDGTNGIGSADGFAYVKIYYQTILPTNAMAEVGGDRNSAPFLYSSLQDTGGTTSHLIIVPGVTPGPSSISFGMVSYPVIQSGPNTGVVCGSASRIKFAPEYTGGAGAKLIPPSPTSNTAAAYKINAFGNHHATAGYSGWITLAMTNLSALAPANHTLTVTLIGGPTTGFQYNWMGANSKTTNLPTGDCFNTALDTSTIGDTLTKSSGGSGVCNDTNSMSTFGNREIQFTTSASTPPGTYQMVITMTGNGTTNTINWPIIVDPLNAPFGVTSTILPNQAPTSYPPIPNQASYLNAISAFGQQYWLCAQDSTNNLVIRPNDNTNLTGVGFATTFGAWFYDGVEAWFGADALRANWAGDAIAGQQLNWSQCRENIAELYRDKTVLGVVVPAILQASRGYYRDYALGGGLEGQALDKQEIAQMSTPPEAPFITTSGSYSSLTNPREVAYATNGFIHAVAAPVKLDQGVQITQISATGATAPFNVVITSPLASILPTGYFDQGQGFRDIFVIISGAMGAASVYNGFHDIRTFNATTLTYTGSANQPGCTSNCGLIFLTPNATWNLTSTGTVAATPMYAFMDYGKDHIISQLEQACITQDMSISWEEFMLGLSMRTLVDYYTLINQDPRIPPILKSCADFLYSDWQKENVGNWHYVTESAFGHSNQTTLGQPTGTTCTNEEYSEIVPVWAWLYNYSGLPVYQQEGDLIFGLNATFTTGNGSTSNTGGQAQIPGGCYKFANQTGAFGIGSGSTGKVFSQHYYWGPLNYIAQRNPIFNIFPGSVGVYNQTQGISSTPQVITLSNPANPGMAASTSSTFFGMHTGFGTTPYSTPILSPIVVGALGKPVGTHWPYMETSRGVYNFNNMTNAINFAQANNVPVFYSYQQEPQWAVTDTSGCVTASDGTVQCPSAPSDLTVSAACQAPLVGTTTTDCQLKEFTTTLVQRYKSTGIQTGCTVGNPQCNGVIQMYEGWNEPAGLGAGGVLTNAQLVTVSTDFLNTIRANDPGAQVCSPGFSFGTSGTYTTIINNFFSAGGPTTYDCYDFHINEATPEAQITDINAFKTLLTNNGVPANPTIYATEAGRWGDCAAVVSGMTQQAYIGRIELLYASNGIKRHYWYAYGSCVPLTNQPTTQTLNAAGIGYGNIESWMTGATISTPCSATGTVWTCGLTRPGGYQALAVWDTSGSSTFSVPSQYHFSRNLEGGSGSLSATVAIGTEPILLETLPSGPAIPEPIGNATITGTDAARFAVTQTGCGNTTLAVGGTCTMSVVFTPAAGANAIVAYGGPPTAPNTFLNIPVNGTPWKIPLYGVGVIGMVTSPTVNPLSGSYSGTQNVQFTPTPLSATICYTTSGESPAGNGNVTTGGGGGTCAAGTVAPSGAVSISSNKTFFRTEATAPGYADSIGLPQLPYTITGTPVATLDPPLNFGYQGINTTVSGDVVLANTGVGSVTVSNAATVTPAVFAVTNLGSCFAINNSNTNFTLPQGQSCTFRITFTPTALIPYSDTFSVTNNASGSPQTVSLNGIGSAVGGISGTGKISINGNVVIK